MNSVKRLIFRIKTRPELYIGSRSLSLLQAYLYGWLNRDEASVVDGNLIGEFQGWIAEKYRISSTQSWAQIILFYSVDERDALEKFFRLFDEFLKENEKSE